MPRISSFYGITIAMYWDERDHQVPHFHAEYAGQVASVALDGSIIAGALAPRARRLVREWARLHEADFSAIGSARDTSRPSIRSHPFRRIGP